MMYYEAIQIAIQDQGNLSLTREKGTRIMKALILTELDNEPHEIREAIAFYAAHTVLPIHFTAAERERHYVTLENAGYLEKIS